MDGPLPNWEAELSWILKTRDVPEEGEISWGDLVPHNPGNAAETIYSEGQLWVDHQALLDCGYLNLEAGYIVFLNGVFYELQGYDRPRRRWWLEEVVIDASDLTPELIIGYGEEA